MLIKIYKKLGPLGVLLITFLGCLLVFALNRIALGVHYSESLTQVENYLFYLPVGVRTDTIILCLMLSIPVLFIFLLPNPWVLRVRSLFVAYLTMVLTLFLFMEITSWPFLEQFSSRPNQMFFRYFTHPKEVLSTVWAQYKILLVIVAIVLFIFIKQCWKFLSLAFEHQAAWSYKKQLMVFPLVLVLMLLGARSGIGEATPNPSIAAFSNDYLTNQIALNATYSLSYAVYISAKASMRSEALFGKLDKQEVYTRIRNSMDVAVEDFSSETLPTLHRQQPLLARDKPLNLVVIVMEGWGAKRIGILGGYDITPNFDELAKDGALFTNIYSIGTRTSRGLEALVVGYPPSARSTSILKQDLAQHNFFTLAALLKKNGYETSFMYGGEAYFDNMAGFFLGNGFDEIIDENDFLAPEFYGTWGVSDEDLFVHANNHFKRQGDKPFASVLLTLSNHPPFDFPENKIELVEQPADTEKNASKYADYALGRFFELARQEAYFKNTVFLITGDHPISIKGNSNMLPVAEFQIPALIIAPDVTPQTIDTLGSQLDLPTTVVSLLGFTAQHPMIGRNLLTLNPKKGRVIMIFGDNFAYRENEKVVVYQPHKKSQSFEINQAGEFVAMEENTELVKNGLAHLLFPGIAYEDRVYRLP